MTAVSAPEAPARVAPWECELFSTTASRPGHGPDAPGFGDVGDLPGDSLPRLARVSARAAYQEALFNRALLVDIRPQAQRGQEGEVHQDLGPVAIEPDALARILDPRHPSLGAIADFRELRVILICQDGDASDLAADGLLRLGNHRSTDIIGGFAAWRAAGLPCNKGPVAGGTLEQ